MTGFKPGLSPASARMCYPQTDCMEASARPVKYYPLFLDLRSRKVLVVGAGRVAARKTRPLLQAGAKVSVVAPRATVALQQMAAAGQLRWYAREYAPGDMNGAALVFTATNSAALEQEVAAEAARRGIPANCAGWPASGTFLVPAQVRRGSIQVAISTGGASPALAAKLRQDIQKQIGPEYTRLARLLAQLRPRVQETIPAPGRARLFRKLAGELMLGILRKGETLLARDLAEQMLAKEMRRSGTLQNKKKRKSPRKARRLSRSAAAAEVG